MSTTAHDFQRPDCRWGQSEKGGGLKRQTECDGGPPGSLASVAICEKGMKVMVRAVQNALVRCRGGVPGKMEGISRQGRLRAQPQRL